MYRKSQKEYNTPGIFDAEDDYASLTDQEWEYYLDHHVNILTDLVLREAYLKVRDYIQSIFTHPKGAELDFVADIINQTQENVSRKIRGEYWEQDILNGK